MVLGGGAAVDAQQRRPTVDVMPDFCGRAERMPGAEIAAELIGAGAGAGAVAAGRGLSGAGHRSDPSAGPPVVLVTLVVAVTLVCRSRPVPSEVLSPPARIRTTATTAMI